MTKLFLDPLFCLETTYRVDSCLKENSQILTDDLLKNSYKLGSVAGLVIQANGRLTFEDDLRPGGLLFFISMNASVCTELADSMVTPGEPGGD